MSERESNGSMVRAGSRSARNAVLRWIPASATLAALVFALGASSRAQSQSAASKSALADATTTAEVAAANPAPAMQAATAKPAAESAAPKGESEGIKVHGHWTIEVRNPDGKVVTHREFENALSPGFAVPTVGQAASGEAFLSALHTGQVVSPVPWGIFLEGPSGLGSGTNAPCVVTVLSISPGACLIFQNSTNSTYASFVCSATPQPAGTSCNLAASPLGTAPNFTGFQLTGSVIATQSGSVNFVATGDFGLCGGGAQPAPNCAFPSGSNIAAFTGRALDGNTAAGDPNPVPVTTGQTIAVTVTISFQ